MTELQHDVLYEDSIFFSGHRGGSYKRKECATFHFPLIFENFSKSLDSIKLIITYFFVYFQMSLCRLIPSKQIASFLSFSA